MQNIIMAFYLKEYIKDCLQKVESLSTENLGTDDAIQKVHTLEKSIEQDMHDKIRYFKTLYQFEHENNSFNLDEHDSSNEFIMLRSNIQASLKDGLYALNQIADNKKLEIMLRDYEIISDSEA